MDFKLRSALVLCSLLTLTLALTACGGSAGTADSSSAADDSQDSQATESNTTKAKAEPSYDYGMSPTTPEMEKHIAHLEIDPDPAISSFSSNGRRQKGLTFHYSQFSRDKFGAAQISIRVDNDSQYRQTKLDCTFALFKDGEKKSQLSILINYSTVVDIGESAIGTGAADGMNHNGFTDYDAIKSYGCGNASIRPDRDKDVLANEDKDNPIDVEFIEFLEDSRNEKVQIKLKLTNNGDKEYQYPNCIYDAMVGNVIVDNATVRFKGKEKGSLAVGETAEGIARFNDTVALADFDSESFNRDNLHCYF